MTVRTYIGATNIVDSGAIALVGGQNNAGWEIALIITCRSVGAMGTVIGQGEFRYQGNTIELVSTSTTTVDTTSAQALDVTAEWGTADASNTITCTNLTVEVLK